MKNFLILGAGTAGTLMARSMSNKLDPQEWKIIVVDRDKAHYYQPGFLFIPFGIYKPGDVIKSKTSFIPRNVEMIWSDIELIEPDENRVTLTEGNRVIQYDELVIATGVDIRPDQTEGLDGAGWRQNIFDFYTYEGSVKLAEALKRFDGGRLVLNVSEMPVKCPVAPLEFIFLADWYLRQRGIRNKVDLVYSTPLPDAFTKARANAVLGDMFAKRGIVLEKDFAISDVDSSKNVIHSYDGRELGYDLLVSIPTNMGADVLERSGIGDDLNYVPVDKFTMQSKQWENVWAVGDTTNLPSSKAGSVAHFQHEMAVHNILQHIQGKTPDDKFDGHSLCYIESGAGKAILIDFNYDVDPVEGTYPVPGIGPFQLLKETTINHWGKLIFRYMYWAMMAGINVPLPSRMSKAGKKL
jgi:sulfide:quinone oxidoreductase